MNARSQFPSCFGEPVTGELLCCDWQQTDTLQLCLYGDMPTHDDGYTVTGVTVPGSLINIAELFSADQLANMGQWLDFKDDTNPTLRNHAMRAKHEAMRGNY